jgi:putative transposase
MYDITVKDDSVMENELIRLAQEHPSEGFWKAYHRLRLAGRGWNHKHVHRVYKALGLSIRRKRKRRLPERPKTHLEAPLLPDRTWSMDFMEDRLLNGRKVRCLNVLDDFNREALHVEIDHSLKSSRVIWVLNRLMKKRSMPERIRMDNGPEYIANMIQDWALGHGIHFSYIQPGKPTQNAYVERYNGSFRRGVLDAFEFETLDQVRQQAWIWIDDYNNHRPHDSLGDMPPTMYARKVLSEGARPLGENLDQNNNRSPEPTTSTQQPITQNLYF